MRIERRFPAVDERGDLIVWADADSEDEVTPLFLEAARRAGYPVGNGQGS